MPALDYLWGKAFAEYDTDYFFKTWHKPALLLMSDYDYLVAPTDLWDEICQKYHIPMIKFEHSGHNPMLEEPIRYHEAMVNFVSK